MRTVKFKIGDKRHIEDGFSEYTIHELLNLAVVSFNNNDYQVIRQYTGLKDTSYKKEDIYEGDIVHFTYGIPPVCVNAEVAFVNGTFVALTPKHTPIMTPLGTLEEYVIDFEVIGNIHENPELLETT